MGQGAISDLALEGIVIFIDLLAFIFISKPATFLS
jgi:hypothetical protein